MPQDAPATSLQPLLAALALFWVIAHLLQHCLSRTRPVLPTTAARAPAWHISLHALHLRVHTTAFNARHDALVAFLQKRRGLRTRRALAAAYGAGALAGATGVLGALLLLLWSAVRAVSALLFVSAPPATTHIHQRRDASPASQPPASVQTSLPVQLLIPGVTVPLAHLPLMLFALLFSQLLHEAGHALAAALDSVQLTSAGAALTVLFPSAFVALPAHAHALPPLSRLRIASAGAFHNLLLWALFAAVPLALLAAPAYKDVGAWGRVVVRVSQGSALSAHLPVGAVITKLDDVEMVAPGDVWTSYLSGSPHAGADTDDVGWCVDRAWFTDQPSSCCTAPPSPSPSSPAACFISSEPPLQRCVDPLPFLDASLSLSTHTKRCRVALDCGGGALCVRPRGDQALLRLTLQLPPWLRAPDAPRERVVVWNGPRADVLAEVEVSRWLPRERLLPLRLPLIAGIFAEYMKMLNLSLYFLNLLPLVPLDGAQALDALMDCVSSWGAPSSSVDEDAAFALLEGGHQAPMRGGAVLYHGRWKHRIQRTVQGIIVALVALCVFAVIWNVLTS